MDKVSLRITHEEECSIIICENTTAALENIIREMKPSSVMVVCDENTKFMAEGIASITGGNHVCLKAGEGSKTMEAFSGIIEKCISAGMDRNSLIVSVGGGVVSDVSGFSAATYLRGIKWINIPTTLLGMVDSGIGGKTGINSGSGLKNMIGSFRQPDAVIINPSYLLSLPERQIKNAMAEIIKHNAKADKGFFL